MSAATIAAKARLARVLAAGKAHGHAVVIVRTADLELLLTSATDTSAGTTPSPAPRDEAPAPSTPSDRGRAAPELDPVLREYSIPADCVHTDGGRS